MGDNSARAGAAPFAPQPAAPPAAPTLLPCPFCGAEARTCLLPVKRQLTRVLCMNDQCAIGPHEDFESEAEAIAAWNRRCDPVRDELVEALEQAAMELEEAAKLLTGRDMPAVGRIYDYAAKAKRSTLARAKAAGPADHSGDPA
jgi:transcription elongation factor Elf1